VQFGTLFVITKNRAFKVGNEALKAFFGPAPAGTVKARIQFTKTLSDNGFIEIDNVVFGRLV